MLVQNEVLGDAQEAMLFISWANRSTLRKGKRLDCKAKLMQERNWNCDATGQGSAYPTAALGYLLPALVFDFLGQ